MSVGDKVGSKTARIIVFAVVVLSLISSLVVSNQVLAATTPSVLVITDTSTGNPYAPYLKEILATEGVGDVEVRPIADLNSTLLSGRRVVILGESTPTATQISDLDAFVTAGGGLIAMSPASSLDTLLGIATQSGTTLDGYMQITDPSTGAGLYTGTMQFHGPAKHMSLNGASQVAKLYSDRSSPTSWPAVTLGTHGSGRTAAFAYDLAQSIVLTRQGNPANANVDTDHDGYFRNVDLYTNWVDLQRTEVPQADIQQRLFVRLIEQVNAQPVPRIWYFPNAAPTVLVVTADAHANPVSYYQTEIDTLLQHNAKLTIYLAPTAPPKSTIDGWISQGVDFGPHPYVDCGYDCGYSDEMSSFNAAYGYNPQTTRTHMVRWAGWADAAAIESSYGLKMDFTAGYQWGPYLTPPSGPALGYMTGSGQPMHFVDASGNILPLYMQNTLLVDEELAPGIGIANLDPSTAMAASRSVIDNSVSNYHTPITMQAHVDYFSFGGVYDWDLGTIDYALQKGAVSLTAQDWLNFVNQRAATTMSDTTWSNNTLTFSVSAGGAGQSMLVPLRFRGATLTGLKIGGVSKTYTTQTIDGVSYAVIGTQSGTYQASYTADTTAPTVASLTPANGSSNVQTTSSIQVQFSEVMDRSTAQASFSVNPVTAGSFSWDASGTTMTYTANSGLTGSTNYTATISTGATDLAGNHLAASATTSFTTARITPPPTITSLSPATGYTSGGTSVTITGTDFTNATSVTFDTSPGSFAVNSDTSITVTAPAHAAGVVNVSVTTPAGTSAANSASRFTYLEPSAVTAEQADPGLATSVGGTRITITGSAFAGGAAVAIGGVAATNVTVINSEKITVTAPAHAAGVVDLVVTNPDGQQAVLPGGITYIDCPTGCVSDTTSADFQAGSLDANGYVAESGDGELQLAPASGSEFTGSSLPSGWTTSPWSSGGSASLANGSLSVDGALVTADPYRAPGHTLNFVATFVAGAPFQHLGFGTDLNSAPWAIFSTGASGDTLYARSNSGAGNPIDTPLSSSWLNAPHHFQIIWTSSSVTYLIDGTQVAEHALAITGAMRPVISDGPVGGATLQVDWLRLSPYATPASFASRVFDGGGTTTWTSLGWTADQPSGTSLTLQVRTGTTPTPDSSWSAWQPITASGQALNLVGRYLQYQAQLTTSNPDETPALRDVLLAYSRNGTPAPTIDSIAPAAGGTAGGTNVTITGQNFGSGATVSFGSSAATNVAVIDATTITATSPAHSGGPVDVVVKNPDDQQGVLTNGFTYQLPPPAITQVSPNSGSIDGGTTRHDYRQQLYGRYGRTVR